MKTNLKVALIIGGIIIVCAVTLGVIGHATHKSAKVQFKCDGTTGLYYNDYSHTTIDNDAKCVK